MAVAGELGARDRHLMTTVVIQADRHPSQKGHMTPDRDGQTRRVAVARIADG